MKPALRWLISNALLLGFATLTPSCEQIAGIEKGELAAEFRDDNKANNQPDAGKPNVAPEPTLCESYCATVDENCTGDSSQYSSRPVCERVCDELPVGEPGDTTGNTVGCRTTNAALAAVTGEPEANCPVAGPGGEDVCGSKCEAYCILMTVFCPAAFDSRRDCETECALVPDLDEPFSAELHQQDDTIQCRLYHVSQASVDPITHCRHSVGGLPCR
jgi:hypothetical protein